VTDDNEFSSYYISKKYKDFFGKAWKDDEDMWNKYLDAKMKFVKSSSKAHATIIEPAAVDSDHHNI